MTKTAAIAFEVRWRKNNDPANLWSSPVSVSADGHVSVPGLERVTDYIFEARAISGCGAKSAWATQTFNLPDAPAGTLTLAGIETEVTNAQTDADTANAQLADIASDNILSPAEKPTVMRDYSVITSEQAGIDGQAVSYLGANSTQQTDYDNAISTLTAYLNSLNTPTAWNNKSGNTDILGTSFRSYFNNVYTTRQTLLNAIYAQAQALANNAQNTANTATTTANSNTALVQNPFFATGDLTGWYSDHGTYAFEQGTNGPVPGTSQYARRDGNAANPSDPLRNRGRIPVAQGSVVKAACNVRGIAANGTAGVRISWRGSNDAEISVTSNDSTLTGTFNSGATVVGTAPAGAAWAHVEGSVKNHTSGTYTFDNFAASLLTDNMDQVPDGTSRFGAVEAGADKTSGKPLSSLSGRTMDYIGDSATRFASAYDAPTQRGIYQPGQNLIPNPSGALGFSGIPNFGWIGGGQQSMRTSPGLFGLAGPWFVCWFPGTGGIDQGFSSILPAPDINMPGLVLSADMDARAMGTGNMIVGLRFYDSGMSEIDASNRPQITAINGTEMTRYSVVAAPPSGTVYIEVDVRVTGSLSSNSAVGWRNLKLEVGTVATPFNDLASQMGNQLTNPGSGQTVGDQRNLLPVTWAGVRSVIASANPISFSISGTTVNFSVTAFTLQGGGISISYNGSSGSVTQAAGTTATWYLYYRDPTSSGGSKTLGMTIYPQDLAAYPDVVRIGSATATVASGGGGSSGTGSGGGGGSGNPPGYPVK